MTGPRHDMYILEVIPLIPLPHNTPQILSYFHDRQLVRGAVIQVPFGSRKIQAVVVSSAPLEKAKIAVKKSSFQLKKIASVVSEDPWVDTSQFQLAAWISRNYYSALGVTLKTVLPPFFGVKKYMTSSSPTPPPEAEKTEARTIEIGARESIPHIRKLIRQQGQTLLIVPEKTTADFFAEEFKDLEPTVLYSRLSNDDYARAWNLIRKGTARCIIGTRLALFAPFVNLAVVIVDDPANEAYKSEMTPRYETAAVAQQLAQLHGADFATITPVVTAEEFHLHANKQIKVESHKAKVTLPKIIDMVEEIKTGNLNLFSRSLEKAMIDALDRQKRVLLYSARRAYAGTLVCHHCGFLVRCKNCEVPMRVHKTSEMMIVCYHCSAYQPIPDQCPNCKSKNLRPTGVPGSQKIQEEIESILAKHGKGTRDIFILDSDLIRTAEQENTLMQAIDQSPVPIVIATQMILSYRYNRSFALMGVPNVDALANNADFRTDERLLYQFSKLQDFNPETLIVQTYHPASPALQALSGSTQDFYGSELQARQIFRYPPFSRLVKLEYRHPNQAKAAQTARLLSEKIKMAAAQLDLSDILEMLGPYPAFISRENNKYIYQIVLKLNPKLEKLDIILKYIPSDWLIDVDPKSIV